MSRHGFIIGIRPEKLEEYKRLHRDVWPDILDLLREAHVSNYTIFQKDDLMFGVFDYGGTDLDADFAVMNAAPIVKQWYALCAPCQRPFENRRPGEWWSEMDMLFHMN